VLTGYDAYGIDFDLQALIANISGTVMNTTSGIPAYGVTISLYREDAGEHIFVEDTSTGIAGSYGFNDLSTGTYSVEIAAPQGYEADTINHEVTLVGSDVSGVDFNLHSLIAAITGTVMNVTLGEPAPGVPLVLYREENGSRSFVDDTVTSVNGTYGFADLVTAAYVVEIAPPIGFAADTISKEVALAGSNVAGVDFNLHALLASVSGTVTDVTSSAPAYGVTVALYREVNAEHLLVDDTITNAGGTYSFGGIYPNSYVVEIIVPIGFSADPPSREFELAGSDVSGMDFLLSALVAMNEAEGLGFWKHEANVILTGKGHLHENEDDIQTNFPQAIFDRFYGNEACPVHILGVTYVLSNGAPSALSVEAMQSTLSAGKGITSLDKAKMHYLTLLLNVVANKVGQQVKISQDKATVSQAIVRVRELIMSGTESDLAKAKSIAESINEGVMVAAGLIPSSTPNVYFTQQQPAPTVALNQNWPNPFNPTTTIGFTLEKAGNHELVVYDITGSVVKVLSKGQLSAGIHTVQWDGTNSRGKKVSSGTYFYRLRAGSREMTHKMILMR
jgi:5-hydroxyisourate hydrolase-like protein (transthyretin family)